MTPKVPDYGHHGADKELMALIRRLHLSYRQAKIGLSKKIEDYLSEFEKQDAEKRALYDSGELSDEEYAKWKYSTLAGTKQWKNMLNQLSNDMTNQNQIAASMIDDTLPGVYALNHNYGTFEAEKGSGFDTTYTLYDKNVVKRLLTEHDIILPKPSVDIPKDMLWNRQHLQSAMLQGILTGESMKDISKRFQHCTDMTENAAIRNARTAVTGAENAGRIDSYIRAEKMGIKMKQMWLATLDGRTRDSHAILDGEQQEIGKKFSNGCRYPGDPQGAPAECYNCRCTVVAVVEGADLYNPNLRKSSYLEDEGLTYDEWKRMHGEKFYSKLFKDDMNFTEIGKRTRNLTHYENERESKGYVGLSGTESDEFMNKYHNKKIIGKNGLNTMDGAQSTRINNALRNNLDITSEKDKKLVELLDSEITNNKLPQDMTLFRGCPLNAFKNTSVFENFKKIDVSMDNYKKSNGRIDYDAWGKAYEKATEENLSNLLKCAKNLIGVEVEDKGFMLVSASSQRNIFQASDINLQIHAPEGLNAYISNYKEESEIILSRNTKLRIVGAEISEVKFNNGNIMKILQLIAEIII